MKIESARLNSKSFLAIVVFLQLAMLVTVLLNIVVARQVVGFLYLTFVPGFLIVKLLKLGESSALEVFLFSVGLSVAFLMFTGFLINEFYLLSGFSRPLSIIPLLIILSAIIFVIGIWAYLRNSRIEIFKTEPLSFSQKVYVSLLVVLPILSVVGAMWVNVYENNMILLFMITEIAFLFVVGVLSKKFLPPRLYPFAVFTIAVSLVFHASLISGYIYYGDIHMEYFVFKTTESSAQWNSVWMYPMDTVYGRLYSMLSVTILPTIYSVTLNLDATWVLKILFPIVFSLVPLALYKLWQETIGAKRAFLASFLFMAMSVFYAEMLGLNRQIIAELFLVLLLLVILSKNIKPLNKMILFTIFSVALITSHYAIAEIFLIFLSLGFVLLIAWKRPSRKITASMIVLFFSLMFGWYIYTSNSSVFNSFTGFGQYVFGQLGNFFDPASRGQVVLRGLGLEAAPSIWNSISRIFAYVTQALIVVGFIGMLLKRAKTDFEKDYFVFGFVALVFLVGLVLVPGLANTLNMDRFYHILLFFLAPFCIIGAEVVVGLVSKRRTKLWVSILLLVVLVPYFLFQTGFVYEVAGVQGWSIPLSKYRMDSLILMGTFAYVNSWKVSSALWLNENIDVQSVNVTRDLSTFELDSYGMMRNTQRIVLSNTTQKPPNGIVYLSYLNIVEGIIVTYDYNFNTTRLSYIHDMNKIYSSDGSELYASSG
jgi:uncharacterized membrane protein